MAKLVSRYMNIAAEEGGSPQATMTVLVGMTMLDLLVDLTLKGSELEDGSDAQREVAGKIHKTVTDVASKPEVAKALILATLGVLASQEAELVGVEELAANLGPDVLAEVEKIVADAR